MSSAFHPVLTKALESALRYLDHLPETHVAATVTADELRQRLNKVLPAEGTAPEDVLDDLIRDTSGGILNSAGGRFFAWVIGGSLPSALAADWMTSTWDQNAGIYACGPAAAVVEEVAGAWLKDLFALPPTASVGFVTGCQMAHFTALAAARHAVLQQHGWDLAEDGLQGAPVIRVLTGDQVHASVPRALRFLGLGKRQLQLLPTDQEGKLPPHVLEAALQSSTQPTIVVLQAADVNTGTFDDFEALVPIAKNSKAWVHVDGAFGLWAAASARYAHLTRGMGLADSWATDGHKWLNVPYDSGLAIVRDTAAHRAAMSVQASYMPMGGGVRDQVDWNPEWSRRARGFAAYAALRELGRNGVARLVEGCCDAAMGIVEGLGKLPGVEVVAMTGFNQGLVRFLSPVAGATESDHAAHTDAVIAKIQAQGGAYFGGTTWRGTRAMRISVSNFRTGPEEVARTVEAVRAALTR